MSNSVDHRVSVADNCGAMAVESGGRGGSCESRCGALEEHKGLLMGQSSCKVGVVLGAVRD